MLIYGKKIECEGLILLKKFLEWYFGNIMEGWLLLKKFGGMIC